MDENALHDTSRPSVGTMMGVSNTTGKMRRLRTNDLGQALADLATALSKDYDSILTHPRGADYANLTADTVVQEGGGKLLGIFCAAASATPLCKVWDSTAASGAVLIGTFTPVAGTMYTFPAARYATGLYVDVGGTVDLTIFYDPTAV